MANPYEVWHTVLTETKTGDYGYPDTKQERARERIFADLANRDHEDLSQLLAHAQWLTLISARNPDYLPWLERCKETLCSALIEQLKDDYASYPQLEAQLREQYEARRASLRERRAALLRNMRSISANWQEVADMVGKSRAALGKEVDAAPSFDPFATVSLPTPGFKVEAPIRVSRSSGWGPFRRSGLVWVSHTKPESLSEWYGQVVQKAESEGFRLITIDVNGRITGTPTPRHLVPQLLEAASHRELYAGMPWCPPTLLFINGLDWLEEDNPITKEAKAMAGRAAMGETEHAVVAALNPRVWPAVLTTDPLSEGHTPWDVARRKSLMVLGPPVEGICRDINPYWTGEEPDESEHPKYLGAWRDSSGSYGWFSTEKGISSTKEIERARRDAKRRETDLLTALEAEKEPPAEEPAPTPEGAPVRPKSRGGRRGRNAPGKKKEEEKVIDPGPDTAMNKPGLKQFLPDD